VPGLHQEVDDMSPDFTGLTDLAAKSPIKVAKGWEPLTPADLGDGMVLAFDQSITACGYVALVKVGSLVTVTKSVKISDPYAKDPKGVERDLKRSVHVFEQAVAVIDWAVGQGYDLSHESPPNPSQVKGGGTGSLMGAVAVRAAAAVLNRPIEMLGAQPAKKIVCGSANADKPTAHAALREHVFPWLVFNEMVTNEAQRDALMNGLLWLYRRPK
jgi:hypothetical protein